jgi:hypothetical protein
MGQSRGGKVRRWTDVPLQPLPLPWRLPEGLVRRENIRRWRIGRDGRRRSEPVKRQQRREVEEQKEAEAWKAEAEQREHLARDKVAREAAAAEEQQQSLAMGLSGLKLTILAPASIAHMASGSSTQSKGKRKVTEEAPSASQYVLLCIFPSSLTFSVGRGFPRVIHTRSLASLV